MTIYQERKVGTLVIDRSFPGVGRIKRATGTNDVKRAQRYDDMLTQLYETDRLDVLQAIRQGVVGIREVYAVWQQGDRRRLPTVESVKGLEDTAKAWWEAAKVSESHRRNHRQAFALLMAGERAGSTMNDLPPLLKAYRKRAKGHVMFNRVRASVLAFIRDELGRRHRLYEECADIPAWTEKAATAVVLEPGDLTETLARLGDYAPMGWALVLSGMRTGEYWGRWEVLADRYRIYGTKTEGSRRDVPNLGPLMRPMVLYQAFRRALGRARPGMTPHDLRHTYAHLMELAGIPRSRRKRYMGHGSSDQTDDYEAHEVTGFLVDDAKRMTGLIGPTPVGLKLVG